MVMPGTQNLKLKLKGIGQATGGPGFTMSGHPSRKRRILNKIKPYENGFITIARYA
jgi:hypothetical protein